MNRLILAFFLVSGLCMHLLSQPISGGWAPHVPCTTEHWSYQYTSILDTPFVHTFTLELQGQGNPMFTSTNMSDSLIIPDTGRHVFKVEITDQMGFLVHVELKFIRTVTDCPNALIYGYVHNDLNGNGTLDPGETPAQGENLRIGSFTNAFTDSSGYYELISRTGYNRVDLIHPLGFYITNPIMGYREVTIPTNQDSGRADFLIAAAGTSGPDLNVRMRSGGVPTITGFPVLVEYCNDGSQVVSGEVEIKLPAGATSNASFTSTATRIGSDSMVQSYSNLQPGECRQFQFKVDLSAPVSPGQFFNIDARIDPLLGDMNPSDNSTILPVEIQTDQIALNTTFPCAGDTICIYLTEAHQGSKLHTTITHIDEFGQSTVIDSTSDSVFCVYIAQPGYYTVIFNEENQPEFFQATQSVTFYVAGFCEFNSISGIYYLDNNSNTLFEPGTDNLLPGETLHLMPDNRYYKTNGNGYYQMRVGQGSYVVSGVPRFSISSYLKPPTGQYTPNFATTGLSVDQQDFAVDPTNAYFDLCAGMSTTAMRPGFSNNVIFCYANLGSIKKAGTMTVTMDPLTPLPQVMPAVPFGDSLVLISNTQFEIHFDTLLPGENRCYLLPITIPVTAQLGALVQFSADITPNLGDLNPSNNTDTLHDVVVGSYDPNDKRAFPMGDKADGVILPREKLRYHIRFQNTGTWWAENVRIEDTLSTDFDLESFQMIEASDPYSYSIEGQKITWFFDKIMLPDSNRDEPNSHGHLVFDIDIKDWEKRPEGYEVDNKAYIYFDFNEPIITNDFLTTFRTPEPEDTSRNRISWSRMYPNPTTSGPVSLRFNNLQGEVYDLLIYDMSGLRILKLTEIEFDEVELPLRLQVGTYTYKIRQAGRITSGGRFIVN